MAAITAVGIDVGGARKGFHAVALTDGAYTDQLATSDVETIRHWCLDAMKAQVIAIDAPCHWSTNGRMRACERELMQQGIHCFASPTREQALRHPSDYYGWMLRGEALYRALKPSHPICIALPLAGEHCCMETFPHAITWHMQGGKAQARQKRMQRRELLRQAGIDLEQLSNIDLVDAALCALTAHRAASGANCKTYGDSFEGIVVVPAG
jgi:predicted nuclease with RNAse H fold